MSVVTPASQGRLRRELRLIDVFAISTGAMFSSGLFLLPGIAFAHSGAWMILAYALSAVIVIPAMLSKAELASALPKAGGTYYFVDRAMGPVVGTVGGLGTWIAMGLKNTFALIGIGAYLSLFVGVEITLVALILALVFTAINVVGTRQTAKLQRALVFALVSILLMFVIAGFIHIADGNLIETTRARFAAAPETDVDGFLATVGLVFVSYAGLTKVSGVAEEVERPDRNILLGMVLSLATAAVIYSAGTWVMVMVIDHEVLSTDLSPVATAGEQVLGFLPGRLGVALIVVAAIAAFASTANAGIMSASRYLLAMGRDRLIGSAFCRLGRFNTPTLAVLATGGFVIVALYTLDVISVAKLASAFQLLMFALVNLAVIVMRESKIQTYDPAVRSPFYPWMQLLGIFLSLGLIVEMGRVPMLFTLALVAVCVGWYFLYANTRVVRQGAILHWFERLGRDRFDELEHELWSILKESGLREADPFDQLIARARILELDERMNFEAVVRRASTELSQKLGFDPTELTDALVQDLRTGLVPVREGVVLQHVRFEGVEAHELVMVRAREGVCVEDEVVVQALFFLVSPDADPGQHLRIVAKLATCAEQPEFLDRWLAASGRAGLRHLLTGDVLRRLAHRLTEQLSSVGAERGWQPTRAHDRFASVLVANPGGALDPAIVEFGGRLAELNDARLTLAEPMDMPPAHELNEAEIELLEHSAHAQRLDDVVAPLRERGLDAAPLILPGRPWLEIVREVLASRHELVVVEAEPLPTRGFDSVTQHLLRKCPCPVWVLRPDAKAGFGRVLAAIDATAVDAEHKLLNDQILALATTISGQLDAQLHLVHAWRVTGAGQLRSHAAEQDWEATYERLLHELLEGHEIDPDCVRVHLVEGEPSRVIPEVAANHDIDLIVMGTVSRSGVTGYFIGNTAENVLSRVECGVLTVKPAGFVTPIEPRYPIV